MNTSDFILNFRENGKIIHNNKYSYPEFEFSSQKTKIPIICPIHGLFYQKAWNHVRGRGCSKCGRDIARAKLEFKNFTEEDILFIKNNFELKSASEISRIIKKCDATIIKLAKKLNLKKLSKPNFKYKNISHKYWSSIINGAKNRGLSIEITPKFIWSLYLKQKKKCALSNWDIEFSLQNGYSTASIDRIDSSKGYLKNNVQLVHKLINRCKLNYSEDFFIKMCRDVSKNKIEKTEIIWENNDYLETISPVRRRMDDSDIIKSELLKIF